MRRRWRIAIAAILSTSSWAAIPVSIGPFGGPAAVVQVDARRPGTVIAATSNALFFRSADAGETWNALSFPGSLRATLHAFVVTSSGAYLAGLEDPNRQYAGLFRSLDDGRTWVPLPGLGRRDVWSIAVFQTNSRVIAVGVSDGVFITRDDGQNWQRISPESNAALRPVVSLAFDPLDSRILYAGTPHLPWKTGNGGRTWTPAIRGMENDSDVFSIIVAEPFRHVLASACSGIYRSVDRGDNWKKLPVAELASYLTYQVTQHPRLRGVFFAATAHGLVKSVDGGKIWRRVSSESTRSIAFDASNNKRLYVATDDTGLFRSDDLGETLKPVNAGFCNRRVLSMTAWRDSIYVTTSASHGGIYRSKLPGRAWRQMAARNLDLENEPVLKFAPRDRGLFALTPRCVMFSPDVQGKWEKRCLPSSSLRLIDMLVVSGADTRITVAAEDAIYYADLGGRGWSNARLPQIDSPIRSLVSLGGSGVAAVTASTLLISRNGRVFEAATDPGAYGELYDVERTGSGAFLLATARGLQRSEDGVRWDAVAGDLNGNTVYAVCKDPSRPNVVFASRYGMVYRSEDDGRSWTRIAIEGPEMPAVKQLLVSPSHPARLLALTHSQGLFSISLDRPEAGENQIDQSQRLRGDEASKPVSAAAP